MPASTPTRRRCSSSPANVATTDCGSSSARRTRSTTTTASLPDRHRPALAGPLHGDRIPLLTEHLESGDPPFLSLEAQPDLRIARELEEIRAEWTEHRRLALLALEGERSALHPDLPDPVGPGVRPELLVGGEDRLESPAGPDHCPFVLIEPHALGLRRQLLERQQMRLVQRCARRDV